LERERRNFITKFKEQTHTPGEVVSSNLPIENKKILLFDMEKRADAHAQGQRDPFTITEPAAYGQWSQFISLAPEMITSAEMIRQYHGNGPSTEDTEKLAGRWLAWSKGRKELDVDLDAVYRRGAGVLWQMERDGQFGDRESLETLVNLGRHVKLWDQYFKKINSAKEKPSLEQARQYLQELVNPEMEERIVETFPDKTFDKKAGFNYYADYYEGSGTGRDSKEQGSFSRTGKRPYPNGTRRSPCGWWRPSWELKR